jgi:hypothetical protein
VRLRRSFSIDAPIDSDLVGPHEEPRIRSVLLENIESQSDVPKVRVDSKGGKFDEQLTCFFSHWRSSGVPLRYQRFFPARVEGCA